VIYIVFIDTSDNCAHFRGNFDIMCKGKACIPEFVTSIQEIYLAITISANRMKERGT
jgi:hypothetical protein